MYVLNYGRFQSVTTGWPQIPKSRIIDYMYIMYRLVEKIDGIITYLTFVLVHQ